MPIIHLRKTMHQETNKLPENKQIGWGRAGREGLCT